MLSVNQKFEKGYVCCSVRASVPVASLLMLSYAVGNATGCNREMPCVGVNRVDALSRMTEYRVCTELQFIIRGFTATGAHALSVLLCVTPMI